MIERIGIVGGGAWGTALALVAARAGRAVDLWARDAQTITAINQHRENARRLPGIKLDANISATDDLTRALTAEAILLAVPAQSIRAVTTLCAVNVSSATPVIVTAKGLERGSGKRMTQVVAETLPQAIPAVLSGPSFATDVARHLPTAVTIAAANEDRAIELCHALASPTFRPYAETDVIGVEVGGAVKNVLAIAAGIVAGRGLGASAVAALVARSFAELRRLAGALEARPDTLMGLSGLGDLVLTCSGPQSRNFAFGRSIGEGNATSQAHPLVEGIETASVARDLARHHGVEMPIVEAVAAIIGCDLDVDEAIDGLMNRPLRREVG